VEEGTIKRYRPDEGSILLAERTGKRRPDLGAGRARMQVVDEVQTLRRLGYKAICIAGRDPTTGLLVNWHTCDDIVENVSEGALAAAAEFVWEMLQEIDERSSS